MNAANRPIQSSVRINNTVFDAGIEIYMEINHMNTRNIPAGRYIRSPTFNFAGGDWALHYFPQGIVPTNQSTYSSSMFLVLLSKKSIAVDFFFKVYAKNNMHALSAVTKYVFSSNNSSSGFGNFVSQDKLDSDYCINGQITICCYMRRRSEREFQLPVPGNLQEHIETLWTKQEDFDITFEVEGECISAHKIILAARSVVFKAELFGHMEEAKLNYIRIDDMKAKVFKALIYFIYTDNLDPSIDDDHALPEDLFVAADRYCLDKLKALCEQQLAADLSIDKLAPTLVLADRHNSVLLKKTCFDYASEPDNFVKLAFTDEYLQAMQDVPSLKNELSEKLYDSASQWIKSDQKRQRIR